MDSLYDKLKRLDLFLKDIEELFLFPDEWNEAYENNYVSMPHSYENYILIYQYYVEKYMEIQKQIALENNSKIIKNELKEYMFITVSPINSTTVKTMYDKTVKFLKSKNIKDYLFVIEQSGKDIENIGHNIHVHILIKHTYCKYSKLSDHLKRIFGDIVGSVSNNDMYKYINIKPCKNSTDVSNRITYMTGDKEGEEKQEKQKYDKLFRERWGIADYYGNINIG